MITYQYVSIRVPVKGEIDHTQVYFIDFNEMKSKLTKHVSKIKKLEIRLEQNSNVRKIPMLGMFALDAPLILQDST